MVPPSHLRLNATSCHLDLMQDPVLQFRRLLVGHHWLVEDSVSCGVKQLLICSCSRSLYLALCL